MTQLLSSQSLIVCSPGNRASEGRDWEVVEGAVLGGCTDGIWRPILSVLVQPLYRAGLQEEPSRARHHSTGGDNWGGCHRDTTQLALPAVRKMFFHCLTELLHKHIKISFEFVDERHLQGFLCGNYLDFELYLYIFLFQRLLIVLMWKLSHLTIKFCEHIYHQTSACWPFIDILSLHILQYFPKTIMQ